MARARPEESGPEEQPERDCFHLVVSAKQRPQGQRTRTLGGTWPSSCTDTPVGSSNVWLGFKDGPPTPRSAACHQGPAVAGAHAKHPETAPNARMPRFHTGCPHPRHTPHIPEPRQTPLSHTEHPRTTPEPRCKARNIPDAPRCPCRVNSECSQFFLKKRKITGQ